MNRPRIVFISASYLAHFYASVPQHIMDNAIFFFGSDRRWVFPTTAKEKKIAEKQPTQYNKFSPEFKHLILHKERNGLVFWLKPEEDYNLVSKFFEGIVDPLTGKNYNPLILDKEWWESDQYHPTVSLTSIPPMYVIRNYSLGEHDYDATRELLFQSNPTLIPVLFPRVVR